MAVARQVAPSAATRAAAIYCRISDDREGQALGVKRQEEDCRRLAERRGWRVAEVYVDNDISASPFSRKRRPAYERLLKDIRAGVVDGLVAWHADRLYRRTSDLEGLISLIDASRIPVATVQSGDLDLATASGRMTARLVGAVGQHESEQKAERIRRKHEQLAAMGKVHGGGTRPFGFKDFYTLDAREARLVREAAERVLAGDSLRSVCRDWNERGVRTSTGRTWYTSALHRLLASARISGRRENHGKITSAKAEWPAIISAEQSDRLRAFLLDPSRAFPRLSRAYLLNGIARCGPCGRRLVSRPKLAERCGSCGSKNLSPTRKVRAGEPRRPRTCLGCRAEVAGPRAYVCASGTNFDGCGRIGIRADSFEAFVEGAVLAALETPRLAMFLRRRDQRQGRDEAREGLVSAEQRQEHLAREWANGHVSRRVWQAANTELEKQIERLRREVGAPSALDPYIANGKSLRKVWPSLTFDRRRAIIGAVVEGITVAPAVRGRNRFDPARVKIAWKV
jgi:site-specific DNA recombinase